MADDEGGELTAGSMFWTLLSPSGLSTCPKISQDRARQRLDDYLRQPQTAEQLVDGHVEQNVDIPVPHGRGGRGGLQDLRPGQDSTAFCGAVDNPVPRVGGLQGLLPRQASTASSSYLVLQVRLLQGVFALFPKFKKCEVGVRTPGRNWPRTRAHAASSWRKPVTESELEDEGEINAWVDVSGVPGCSFNR